MESVTDYRQRQKVGSRSLFTLWNLQCSLWVDTERLWNRYLTFSWQPLECLNSTTCKNKIQPRYLYQPIYLITDLIVNPNSCDSIVDRLFMSYKTKGEKLRMSLKESFELSATRQGKTLVGRMQGSRFINSWFINSSGTSTVAQTWTVWSRKGFCRLWMSLVHRVRHVA